MIPPLVYAAGIQQSLAEDTASRLGTIVSPNLALNSQTHLYLSESGLSFFHPEARSTNQFRIDFNSGSTGWRIKRANHEKLIKKALGRSEKPLKILDCTAGMLQDTLLFLSLGHQVTALEQSKILFYLLQDGISRSEDQSIFNQLDLKHMNACSYASQAKNFDVIYFDPMYPPSKKNALSSGKLEYIAKILEVESLNNNPMHDFEVLQLIPAKKMIVKRPIKAESFSSQLNYQVMGKTTRFDVYI
ncbi:class I SAM-dependent methyltransferase [Gammaproteobacteria bacterium]|nr:class I SAM-dependent methyltransferase [Gammaproteobacteria bacterium]MDB2510660.1 class I SAM-dependent methyltransferase [Gammaproteobacteria bacterium]